MNEKAFRSALFEGRLFGVRIHVSEYAVVTPWVFPKHRFFEWEAKDEESCRALGIGHPGPTEPAAIMVGYDTVVIHPDLWKEMEPMLASLKSRSPANN